MIDRGDDVPIVRPGRVPAQAPPLVLCPTALVRDEGREIAARPREQAVAAEVLGIDPIAGVVERVVRVAHEELPGSGEERLVAARRTGAHGLCAREAFEAGAGAPDEHRAVEGGRARELVGDADELEIRPERRDRALDAVGGDREDVLARHAQDQLRLAAPDGRKQRVLRQVALPPHVRRAGAAFERQLRAAVAALKAVGGDEALRRVAERDDAVRRVRGRPRVVVEEHRSPWVQDEVDVASLVADRGVRAENGPLEGHVVYLGGRTSSV